ncbi:MAG: hypothetical protein HS108_10075 [Planctomycetes bacterium]|jgi:hypothetical protein|nr:hypothetical protein [Planctomycetota bacterium]MCL4730128.1 hypothetical protein [Planctomycetota bacterium]
MRDTFRRLDVCPACGKPAAGEGDQCIFCGAGLLTKAVGWRAVYHAYSYADAMLATSALQSHGLSARMTCNLGERALTGASHGVVQVADGDHIAAREVLRQLRGVRTDTEYLEWQELKHRRHVKRGLLLGTLAALAAAAGFGAVLLAATAETEPAAAEARP